MQEISSALSESETIPDICNFFSTGTISASSKSETFGKSQPEVLFNFWPTAQEKKDD